MQNHSIDQYPYVDDIYDYVPLPFIEEDSLCPGRRLSENSQKNVRRHSGEAPSFPTNPHRFTIPGTSIEDASSFVQAMRATVQWNCNQPTYQTTSNEREGRHTSFHFLEFMCPCRNTLPPRIDSPNNNELFQYGCTAKFTIHHHRSTNTLRVTWFWAHNHSAYSEENMRMFRSPMKVDHWLNEDTVSGLGWKAIRRLLQVKDFFLNDDEVPQNNVPFDRVCNRIRKRAEALAKRDPEIFNSLRIWRGVLSGGADSDVEILGPRHHPKQGHKRPFVDSNGSSQDAHKKARLNSVEGTRAFSQPRKSQLSSSPLEGPNLSLVEPLFDSGMVALKRAVEGLSKLKDQKSMSTELSINSLLRFKLVARTILHMVEAPCLGLSTTHRKAGSSPDSILDPCQMNQREIVMYLPRLQRDGLFALRRAHNFLRQARHKTTFCSAMSFQFESMKRFQSSCFEILEIIRGKTCEFEDLILQ